MAPLRRVFAWPDPEGGTPCTPGTRRIDLTQRIPVPWPCPAAGGAVSRKPVPPQYQFGSALSCSSRIFCTAGSGLPSQRKLVTVSAAPQRRARALKVYKNPNNGEVVETKGGNHKVLKAWKEQYGSETVESWLQR